MRYRIDNDNPQKKKENIRSMFDSIVDGYDRANRIISLGIDQVWRKKFVHHLSCNQNDMVLDVCCGTGDLSGLIRKTDAQVVSLDFSFAMIRKGIHIGNLNEMATVGDASKLPFKNATFTKVCVSFGIRNIPDIDVFLSEVYRVLKPGGAFVILELTRPRYNFFRLVYFLYLNTMLPILGRIISGSFSAYRYLSKTIHTFIDPPSLIAIQEKHGFADVQCKPLTMSIVCIYTSSKPQPESSLLNMALLNQSQNNRVIIH